MMLLYYESMCPKWRESSLDVVTSSLLSAEVGICVEILNYNALVLLDTVLISHYWLHDAATVK